MLMYNKCIQQEIKSAQCKNKNKKNLVFLSDCHMQKAKTLAEMFQRLVISYEHGLK